jgi:hypothetical protein
MQTEYDRDNVVGVLNGKPIPKIAIGNESNFSLDIAMFLLFIHELNEKDCA